jgi:hypothetical protein
MMEALSSSETSVLTRATLRKIPEDAILHSHCPENLKFCNFLKCSQNAKVNSIDLFTDYHWLLNLS